MTLTHYRLIAAASILAWLAACLVLVFVGAYAVEWAVAP